MLLQVDRNTSIMFYSRLSLKVSLHTGRLGLGGINQENGVFELTNVVHVAKGKGPQQRALRHPSGGVMYICLCHNKTPS